MNLLKQFQKAGNFVPFRGRILHMRHDVYHSSMSRNFVLFVVSAPSWTDNETIKNLADDIETILLTTAKNSSAIKKLPLWTQEERQALSATRKFRLKYKTCVEYIKKYVMPDGWKLYSTLEILPSDLEEERYVKFSYSDENTDHTEYGHKLDYDYGDMDKDSLNKKTVDYLDFLISKNLLPKTVEGDSCHA